MATTQSTQCLKSGLNTALRKEVSQGRRGSLPLAVQSQIWRQLFPFFFPFLLLLSLFLFFSFFPFFSLLPFLSVLLLLYELITFFFPYDRILFSFLFFFFILHFSDTLFSCVTFTSIPPSHVAKGCHAFSHVAFSTHMAPNLWS